MTEQKKSLARSFLGKIAQKQEATPEDVGQVASLTAEAGFEKGVEQAANPRNVNKKKNQFKQGIVTTIASGPTGGMQ